MVDRFSQIVRILEQLSGAETSEIPNNHLIRRSSVLQTKNPLYGGGQDLVSTVIENTKNANLSELRFVD